MKNLIPILTILILLTNCKRAAVDLKGHWHVWEYKDPTEYPEFYQSSVFDESIVQRTDSCESFNRPHEMLDVLDDSTAVWNKGIMGYSGTIGWLDKEQLEIEIGGEDLHLQFNYNLKNDTLFLKEGDSIKYIATKSGCCDKQKEFFSEVSRVEINLPALKDTLGFARLNSIERTACPDIEIGHVMQAYQEYTLPIRFLLGGDFKRKDDVKAWLENDIQSIPPNFRGEVIPIVYGNQLTDFKLFFDLINELRKNGIEKIYLAFRENDFSSSLNVWLTKLELNSTDYQSFIKNSYRDFYLETGEIRVDIEDFN